MTESPETILQQEAGPMPTSAGAHIRYVGRDEDGAPRDPTLDKWSKFEIEAIANRLAAIAHPLRLAIVCLLAQQGERSVNEICETLWTSQPNISQHLGILYNRNLVSPRKEANRVFYSLSDDKLQTLLPLICCAGKPPEQPT